MKITLEEIEAIINALSSARTYANDARRVAKKVYGNEKEVSLLLKYAYKEVQEAVKLLEMKDE